MFVLIVVLSDRESMGDVIVVLRVMPEGVDVIEDVKKGLDELEPQKIEEEPVAFGLKALKVTKIVPDEENFLEDLEEKIRSIKGVQSVEVLTVSRSL